MATTVDPSLANRIIQLVGGIGYGLSLSPLTVDKVRFSAFTVLNWSAGGFAANGWVRVGLYGGFADTNPMIEIMQADANGKVKGTFTLPPDPKQMILGDAVLLAVDLTATHQQLGAVKQNITALHSVNVPAAAAALTAVYDANPPVSKAIISGPLDERRKIFLGPPTVKVTATDDLSGILYIEVSIDGGRTWVRGPQKAASFNLTLPANGLFHVMWRAADGATPPNIEDAHDGGWIAVLSHVIASGDKGASLAINATTHSSITGNIHSNGTISLKDNTGLAINGSVDSSASSGNVLSGNTPPPAITIATGTPTIPLPSYQLADFVADAVFPSKLVIDSVNSAIKGIIVVNGDVEVSAVNLQANATIIALGNLSVATTGSTWTRADDQSGLLFLVLGSQATINSTGDTAGGHFVVPNGTITMPATNLNLAGSLVGKVVRVEGATGLVLTYNPSVPTKDFPLPLVTAFVVPPAGLPPPVPANPSLTVPRNQGSARRQTALACSSIQGAGGYRFQVAQNSAFSSVTIDQGSFEPSTFVRLPNAGVFYVRCQALGRSGAAASGWSATVQFTAA